MADVFISYAHNDEAYPDRWVSTLHERVELVLKNRFEGEGISIHRDDTVFRKSIPFDAQIRQEVADAAILLCVVSPSYVRSPYCQLEVDYFSKRSKLGWLVRLVKEHVAITAQPEALQELDGANFYDASGEPLEAYDPDGRVSSRFDNAVGRLARDIYAAYQASIAPRQRVLLVVSPERRLEEARLRNELRARQIEVVLVNDLPADSRDFASVLGQRISSNNPAERLDFALLLFGAEPWAPAQLAYDAMAKRCTGPERRCLSSPSSIEPRDAGLAGLLSRVRNEHEPPGYVCINDADVDLLLNETLRYLKALEEALKVEPTLFLQYPKSAREFADKVRAQLRSEHERLAPDKPLRLSDAYGDGDAAPLKTQPQTRDAAASKAHGGLLLQEKPGAFLAAALKETESFLLPSRTGKPIAVYPANAGAIVPEAILEKYPAIVQAPPPYAFIGRSARMTTLAKFLQDVYAQADR